MTTRYYEETPCEHGNVGMCAHRVMTDAFCSGLNCYDPSHSCPGGQRRELTGVEVVEIDQTPGMGASGRKVLVAQSGRYAIIPLEEPE